LGDEYSYFFYRTADGAECDLVICKGEDCLAAIDAKFTPHPKPTKSMTVTIQDLKPQKIFYAVPECPISYAVAENQQVVTPWQLTEIIRSM